MHAPVLLLAITIVKVLTSHGTCPPQSYPVLSERLGRVFSDTVPWRPYSCMSWPEQTLLHGGCARHSRRVMFIHLASPITFRFQQGNFISPPASAAVIGFLYEGGRLPRTVTLLSIDDKKLFHIPLPPGTKPIRQTTPMYGLFDIPAAQQMRLSEGDCPVGARP